MADDLSRQLDARRLSMMALGGAIGTGLFLGSGISVRLAGPGIVLTYAIGGLASWLLMRALAEMTVAHPQAGSFGVIAETYLHPLAGWLVRSSYWFGWVVAIGGQVTAAAIYMRYWFPAVPAWTWAALFSIGIVIINLRAVGSLGSFEYWFANVKVVAILLFLLLGGAMVPGLLGGPAIGFDNLTAHGGWLPNGWGGVWMATTLAIFSYIGTEIVAVAAGESREPGSEIPRALRLTVSRLAIMYMGASFLLVTLAPWTSAGLGESPFVTVLGKAGVPAAAAVTNAIVLTAALSSAVANLYVASRMLFSLAESGYAPRGLGRVDRRGVPVTAVLMGVPLLVLATLANLVSPDRTYGYLLGVATFAGFFVWIAIFVTHLQFRTAWARRAEPLPYHMGGHPWASISGLVLMVGILSSTWFVDAMWIAIPSGLVWLALMTVAFVARPGKA